MDGMRADILSHRVLPCATMNTKFVVRRIGILSFAKLQSALYALFGLIAGAFISLLAALGSVLHDVFGGSGSGTHFGILYGVASIVVFPIVYGVLGFILGLIMGGLYNLVAGVVGGIEIEGPQTQSQ